MPIFNPPSFLCLSKQSQMRDLLHVYFFLSCLIAVGEGWSLDWLVN